MNNISPKNYDDEILEYFASAAPGTEHALCDELRELGFKSVRLNKGGIPFRGNRYEGWRACLQSRIAQRIQVVMSRFTAENQQELYNGIAAVDWTKFITYQQTICISAFCAASNINHSGFAALKAKDAVVDQIRDADKKMRRPSVSKDNADVKLFIYILKNKVTVYLDISGEPLHKRGYRKTTGDAPLRETLAAAILRLSKWDKKIPLIDPLCGSGTIPIEAALMASDFAPGLFREQFGFEKWADFNPDSESVLREIKGKLRSLVHPPSVSIQASDISSQMVESTKINAKNARVKISIKERSVLNFQSSKPSVIVTNPPYDVRLDASAALRHDISSAVCRMHKCRVALYAGHPDYKKFISAKPLDELLIPNGNIECSLLIYDIP